MPFRTPEISLWNVKNQVKKRGKYRVSIWRSNWKS